MNYTYRMCHSDDDYGDDVVGTDLPFSGGEELESRRGKVPKVLTNSSL
jgi:hypothetical protein